MIGVVLLAAVLAPAVARADSFTLAWDGTPEPSVIGYYVYIGTASGQYSTTVDVGNATSYTFTSALPGTTYYLSVAAYTAGPLLGPKATELVTTTGGGPTLANPGNRTTIRGTVVTLSVQASDPNNDPIVFAALGLPPGLSINPTTGVISGAPTTAGNFSVSVTASDPAAHVTTQQFTWTVVVTDTLVPTIAISGPTAAASYATTGAFVTLSGIATDDVGVTTVSWANNRGGAGTAAGTTSWSVVVPLLTGANVITMTARDATNKTSTDTLTVTMTGGTNQAPTVTVTSPTSGTAFTSTSSTVNLSGTATDDGTLSRVTWQNSLGGSGTASGTTAWSATGIALQPGANVLTLTAQDAAGLTSTDTLTITYSPATLQVTGLTSNKAAPQALGSTVTFTATAVGGKAPYQFKWRIYNGASWSTASAWSATRTFAWTPTTAGSGYQVQVWARSAGNASDAADNAGAVATRAFAISAAATGGALQLTTLTPDKAAPQAPATTVTFTAIASGGRAPYQYKWWLFDGYSWSVLREWTAGSTFAWTPTAANSAYRVGVWVRSAGSTADASDNDASNGSVPFPVSGAPTTGGGGTSSPQPLRLASLAADRVAPQPQGTTVVVTAAASGGVAPYQYKWWLYDGSSWTVLKDWSGSASHAWVPRQANGAYRVGVWIRGANSTSDASDNDASNGSIPFPISGGTTTVPAGSSPAAPLRLASLTTSAQAPQNVGTSIVVSATAVGGVPQYQYKWWLFNGASWVMLTDWVNSATYTWVPIQPGSGYRLGVWVRSASNTADQSDNDASNGSIPFVIR